MELTSLISSQDGVDHLAYATQNTDKTLAVYHQLGFSTAIYKKKINKFNIYASKLINPKGDVIELIEPYAKPNPVENLLEEVECTLYHVCFKVSDFYHQRKILLESGSITITKPFESLLFEGYMVTHLYHPYMGLFEIFGRK